MIEQHLSEAVRNGLESGATFGELVSILREHKARGVSQGEAQETLEALRASVDERTEDRILEMLDVVTGFCAPQHRIWEHNG